MKLSVKENNPIKLNVQDQDRIGLRTTEVVNIGTSDYNELTNKPSIEGTELQGEMTLDDINAYTQDEIDTLLSAKANTSDLAEVATTGNYEDLINAPALATVATTGDYDDLSNTPNLAAVATSGNYNDLSNKPTIPEQNLYIIKVGYDDDEDEYYLVDTTFNDICSAYDSGSALLLIYTDEDGYAFEYTLSAYAEDDGFVSFAASFTPEVLTSFTINDDDTVDYSETAARTSALTNDSLFTSGYSAIWQGTCATAAGTASKYVNCSGFSSDDQKVGVVVFATFSNTNTAAVSGLKLNVQGRGAKPIKCLKAGQLADLDDPRDLAGTMPFFYDGTNWVTWYDTSDENTDEKVLQQYQAESGYSYWRPLVIGRSSSGTEGFTPTTYTDQTYVFKTLEVQPSTGTIRMGKASMYQGSYTTKIAPDTLTGNRTVTIPDKTGTLALTDDIPTDTSDLNNDSGFITSTDIPVTDVEVNGNTVLNNGVAEVTVPEKTSDIVNDSLFARGHIAIFNATCSTAAATAEKEVTCSDFKSADLKIGATVLVAFSETNSAAVADLKLNVNGTGAYPIKQNKAGAYSNLDGAGYLKADNTYPFIFNGTYWVTWYNTDTNTIGYNIRTNASSLPMSSITYRYRILFTSADGTKYVPANTSSSTSATASKTVNQEKIDPHGRIVYYATTASVAAGSRPSTAYQYQQYYTVTLGYSFNRTGAALTLTAWKPVYIKCTPQTDGSAIIDSTEPYVQDRPTTNDGYIYIFLGIATSATAIEFTLEHPVYYHDGTAIRKWTGPVS